MFFFPFLCSGIPEILKMLIRDSQPVSKVNVKYVQ